MTPNEVVPLHSLRRVASAFAAFGSGEGASPAFFSKCCQGMFAYFGAGGRLIVMASVSTDEQTPSIRSTSYGVPPLPITIPPVFGLRCVRMITSSSKTSLADVDCCPDVYQASMLRFM